MSKVTVTVKSNPEVNTVVSPSLKKRVLKKPSPEKNHLSNSSPPKILRVDPTLQAVLSRILKDQKKSSPVKKFSPVKKSCLNAKQRWVYQTLFKNISGITGYFRFAETR